MDKTTIKGVKAVREERFRIPSPAERSLGLWVDRMGERTDSRINPPFRLLGQYAAVLVIEGEGVYESQPGNQVILDPGNVIILFPDIAARYYPRQTWHTRWVVWNGPEAGVLEKLGCLNRAAPVMEGQEAVTATCARLFPLMGIEDTGSALERKAIILEMAGKLGGAIKGQIHNAVSDAVKFIRSHYHDPLTVTGLAERFALSPTHFRRLFKESTGRNPREFITAVRMARAKEFLVAGKRVGETARLVGYDDEFYFNRTFKLVTGVTPGKFV